MNPFADRITDVVTESELKEILSRFDIADEHAESLCEAIFAGTRYRSPDARMKAVADKLRERRATFQAALEAFHSIPRGQFVRTSSALSYGQQPPPPPGVPAMEANAIPAEQFEQMLTALIDRDNYVLSLYDAEVADRKAMGNNSKPKRFAFWFALLWFWHEMGRPLTVTVDPLNSNSSGGPLVEFIAALSKHYIAPEERTPHAIAAFIKRNRKRVLADPGFARRLLWTFKFSVHR